MATINSREDQDGITIGWQAIVRRKGHPSQTKTFRAKKDAEQWARSIESAMDKGVWRDTSVAERTTLKEALDRYAQEIIPTKKSGDREMGFLRQWQSRPIAKRFMASIEGQDVATSIREMEAEGKASNTIRLHLALLSHLFNVARKEWRMSSLVNPVESVRKPKLPKGRDRRLVGDEETRLLTACADTNPELSDIVLFAIETAMRQGEIISMEWRRVNWLSHTLYLPSGLTKTDTAREIPLSEKAEEILQRQQQRNPGQDGKVWTYTNNGMRAVYKRAVQRAGIEGLTFHDLRHEATSRLFEHNGFNPMEASAITGHKTLQMLKRYTHLRAEDLAKRMR